MEGGGWAGRGAAGVLWEFYGIWKAGEMGSMIFVLLVDSIARSLLLYSLQCFGCNTEWSCAST